MPSTLALPGADRALPDGIDEERLRERADEREQERDGPCPTAGRTSPASATSPRRRPVSMYLEVGEGTDEIQRSVIARALP